MTYPNPLIPGFNPDPSVVKVGRDYYVVTSSFEYLPGLPVYHSTDFVHWTHIANIAMDPAQIEVGAVPPLAGVWAPTIRHRDGLFYVIVTIAAGRGCTLFTAEDARGPWSPGLVLEGVPGIDPDLAWDDDGAAYVTYSALNLGGSNAGGHNGIEQVRVDLKTGRALEKPRKLWSGSGLQFPEAPHLYKRDGYWYLMIAEGGTESGHGVSIARGLRPEGPFEGFANNPFLSARSTSRPIQNTGHGDLVETPDGKTSMVLLGVRPAAGRQYAPLGRETFVTSVEWVDGWPVAEPVALRPRVRETTYDIAFDEPLDLGWIAPRRAASEFASTTGGALVINGDGSPLSHVRPAFVGRRQINPVAEVTTTIDASRGVGGLAIRHSEIGAYAIEAAATGDGNRIVARAILSTLEKVWEAALPAGPVKLRIRSVLPKSSHPFLRPAKTHWQLSAAVGETEIVVATIDGRLLSPEITNPFTGPLIGLYAVDGSISFRSFSYRGSED